MTVKGFQKHWHRYAIIALVLIAILYLKKDLLNWTHDLQSKQKPTIGSYLACQANPRLDQSIRVARKEKEDDIRLLLHFNERPSADVRDFLASKGVIIYPETWVFDYLVAETVVDHVCFLAELPGISLIALGE